MLYLLPWFIFMMRGIARANPNPESRRSGGPSRHNVSIVRVSCVESARTSSLPYRSSIHVRLRVMALSVSSRHSWAECPLITSPSHASIGSAVR